MTRNHKIVSVYIPFKFQVNVWKHPSSVNFFFWRWSDSNLLCNNTTNTAKQGIWHEIHPPWGKICGRWEQESSLLVDSFIHKVCAVVKFLCLQNLLGHTKLLGKAMHLTTYYRYLRLGLIFFSAKRNRCRREQTDEQIKRPQELSKHRGK